MDTDKQILLRLLTCTMLKTIVLGFILQPEWVLPLIFLYGLIRYWPEFNKPVETSQYFGKGIEAKYWRFFGEHRDYDVYHNLNEQLENLGISGSSAVTNLLDPSFCASLYLMNREGFSSMSRSIDWVSIQNKMDKGASYLIAHDSLLYNQTELEPFKQHLAGNYKAL